MSAKADPNPARKTRERVLNEELTKICAITEPLKVSGDENALEKLKSKVKAELPKSFEDFYKKYAEEASISGFVAGFELLPINRVIAEFDFIKKSGIEFEAIGTVTISDNQASKNKWIPFAFDGSDCFFAIDLSPSKNGVFGQVIGLDMEENYAYLFADSFDAFFEKLTKLLDDGTLVVETRDEKSIVSEKSGHFFNHVIDYAIIDENIQNIDIVLEDDFWLKKFEKKLKNKEGKNVILDLCQYLGHKKLNILSLHKTYRESCLLNCQSLIFNLLWCLVIKSTMAPFAIVE